MGRVEMLTSSDDLLALRLACAYGLRAEPPRRYVVPLYWVDTAPPERGEWIWRQKRKELMGK